METTITSEQIATWSREVERVINDLSLRVEKLEERRRWSDNLDQVVGRKCPLCDHGKIMMLNGKNGMFFSCDQFSETKCPFKVDLL